MIEAHGLSKSYGDKEAIRNISLTVEKGEFICIIGPSGAGKSVLLRILDLIEEPSAGTLSLFGTDALLPENRAALRLRMGMLFQKPIVFNTSVTENVAMGLKFRKQRKADIDRKVKQALKDVGLADIGSRNARNLSGGEQQRTALARVIVTEPEILFLDEPAANLDPLSTATIEELVVRLNRESGTTVVMNTHDMLQGQRLSKKIGVVMNGGMVQVGRPGEVFQRPADKEIARFVGVENILSGVAVTGDMGGTVIEVQGRRIIAAAACPCIGMPVDIAFRAEDVILDCAARTGTSVRNTLPGTITAVVSSGPFVYVHLDCGFPVTALVTMRAVEELHLAPGVQLFASFKATAVSLMPHRDVR